MNKEMKRFGFIIFCQVFFSVAMGQVIIPEEASFKNPVALMKTKGDKLFVVQTMEESNYFVITVSVKTGKQGWNTLPITKVGKLNNKLQILDVEQFGSAIYLGGIFSNVIDPGYNCLLKFDTQTHKWSFPGKFLSTAGTAVNALAIVGKQLWIGGNFKLLNGVNYFGLAKIDTNQVATVVEKTGKIGVGLGVVTSMAVSPGRDSLYIGGTFAIIAGNAIPGLALYKTSDGLFRKVKSDADKVQNVYFFKGNVITVAYVDSPYLLQEFRIQGSGGNIKIIRKDSMYMVNNIVPFNSGFLYLAYAKYPGRGARFYLGYIHPDSTKVTLMNEAITGIDKLELYANQIYVSGSFPVLFNTNAASRVGTLHFNIHRFYGRVFLDKNKNSKFDAGEIPLPGVIVKLLPRNSKFITDIFGSFSFDFSDQKLVVFDVIIDEFKNLPINQFKYTFSSDTFQTSLVNLPIQISKSSFSDLGVNIRSASGWRANNDQPVSYVITVKNEGIVSQFANVKLNYNSKLANISTSIAPSVINTGSLEFNNIFINPNEEKRIVIQSVAPSAQFPANSQIAFSASVNSSSDDYNNNNADTLLQTIQTTGYGTAKFQFPQDTDGSGIAQLTPQSGYVDYLIRIANTSSDTMYSAVVRDTVYAPLYVTYIQETGASHPFSRNVSVDPANPYYVILVYTFNNLKLVPNPSGNPEIANSTAFIGFRMGFNTTVPLGTLFKNTATVYENSTSPLVTNTVKALVAAVAIKKISKSDNYNIYPNPADSKIYLKEELAGLPLYLFSTAGKLIRVIDNTSSAIDISGLAAGSYIWLVKKEGELTSRGILIKN